MIFLPFARYPEPLPRLLAGLFGRQSRSNRVLLGKLEVAEDFVVELLFVPAFAKQRPHAMREMLAPEDPRRKARRKEKAPPLRGASVLRYPL